MTQTPREAAATVELNTIASDADKLAARARAAVAALSAPDAQVPPPDPIVPPAPLEMPLRADFKVTQVAGPLQAVFTDTSTGAITKRVYSWGDGRTETKTTASNVGNTWAKAGSYVVRLTVYDKDGASAFVETLVTVPLAGTPPVVTPPPVVQPPPPPPVVVPPPVTVPPPAGEVVAAFPKVTIGTQAPGITGKTWMANSAPSFQSALDMAQLGDSISVDTGMVLTGNFTLPPKSGAGWIVVRPQISPLAGRLTPKAAAAYGLPVIQSPNVQPAIQTLPGAHHFRFVGLEIRPSAGVPCNTLVGFGEGSQSQRTLLSIPHDLILDRCYVHGLPGLAVQRGVVLNCEFGSVIDSTISEIHDNNGDSQAILGYNGQGPFTLDNLFLESGGEVIMFGGADPGIYGLVPSDITITRCHITSNPTWTTWLRKNLFELKSARRVKVDGCVFEHMPQGGQVGGAILLKSASAGGDPNQGTQDVTMRRCIMRNVRSAFTIESIPEGKGTQRKIDTARITFEDMIVHSVGQNPNDVGIGLYALGNASDVLLRHMTVLAPNSAITLDGKAQRLRIRDSIFGTSQYPIKGDAVAQGIATLDQYAPGWYAEGNVIVLPDQSAIKSFPPRNYYPATNKDIGFVDEANHDYRLSASSKYKGKATDGRDPGADCDAVMSATQGVVIP